MKIQNLILLILLNILSLSGYAVNLSVGQTYTLSINPPRYLQSCVWKISRPDDVVFTSQPSYLSTSVEIKAVHGFPYSSPCIVQCTYYYKELDPVSGKYIYSRSGNQKWNIYVEETPPDDNHGSGTGSAYIRLNHSFLTAEQDKWAGIIYPVDYNGPSIKWEYNEDMAFLMGLSDIGYPSGAVEVKGLAIGRTNIYCTNQSGGKDVCELYVLPKSSYANGDMIKIIQDNIVLNFEVLNNSPKKCAIDRVWKTKVPSYFVVPEEACNYYVTEIADYAFQKNPYIKTVALPSNLTRIQHCAFSQCTELESISFPSSLSTIDESAFWLSSKLCNVVFNEGLKTIERNAFSGTALQRIHLEAGLESIGKSAFGNVPCKELVIPSTVKQIGAYAFNADYRHSYDTIISKINVPFEIEENVFNQLTYDNAILYVPSKSKALYEKTAGWKKFKDIRAYDNSTQILVSDISISPESKTLKVGDTFTFSAIVSPENASDKSVTWRSMFNSIATVSDNGTVTAKSVGSTMIYCTANDGSGKIAYCYLKVTPQEVLVTRVELNKTSDELKIGQTSQLTATVYPSNATNKTVNWKSSNSSVAVVSTSGLVTAKGVGTATITCTSQADNNIKATCKVTVEKSSIKPASITLNKSEATLTEGETLQLTATIKPSDAEDKTVKWTTSKSSVATVSDNGLVTAKSPGTAIITCTSQADNNIKVTCNITVSQSSPDEFTYQGVNYAVIDRAAKTCKITGTVEKIKGSIDIPAYVSNGNDSFKVIEIGEKSFYGYTELTTVSLPNTIKTIGDGAFECTLLSAAVLPDSITAIGEEAFQYCVNLSFVHLPDNLEQLGRASFGYCNLTSVNIPEATKCIGAGVFMNNYNLMRITVSSNNETFSSVNSMLFDKDVKILIQCPAGAKICTIPNSVATIRNSAFCGCTDLQSINIPNSVLEIEDYAFSGCDNLTVLRIPGSVKSIGGSAFFMCYKLTTIHLPNSIKSFGRGVFSFCESIKDVYYDTFAPVQCDNVFDQNIYKSATLHVPSEALEAFETTSPWKNFVNKKSYNFESESVLHSIEEVLDIASRLGNLEYSEEYTVDFEPTVTYVNGYNNYITQDGKYCMIYKNNLGLVPGQIVTKGWKTRLHNYANGLLEMVPTEDTEIIGGSIGDAPQPVYIENAEDINNDMICALVFIPNVVFVEPTPGTRNEYTGYFKGVQFKFFNGYSLNSQPEGKYDVLAIIYYYNGLEIYPIQFYEPGGIGSIENDSDSTIEYYDLTGRRVLEPRPGNFVIRRKNNQAQKYIYK